MIQVLFLFFIFSVSAFAQCCVETTVLEIKANADTFVNQVLREGDVTWTSRAWKLVETKRIPNLVSILQNRVATGDINAYGSEDFKKHLSAEQFRQLMLRNDTIINPNDSGKKEVMIKPKIISYVIIKEDYFFNFKSAKMQRKILGMGLVAEKYDTDGLYSGDELLCWFYYPAIRCCLSKDSLWLHRKKDDTLMTLEAYFTHHWFYYSLLQKSNAKSDLLQRLNIVRGREENYGRVENDYWED